MRLLIATSNPGKLRDFTYAAHAYPQITIAPLPNLDTIPTPDETADTFRGNALLKAAAYATLAPNDLVLADDSGLEVDALAGAPGVRSARYAADQHFPSPGTEDERNNACLLANLAGVANRTAHYRCHLIAMRGPDLITEASGTLTGTLLTAPRGSAGFGYDPLFYLPDHHLTMAEISPALRLDLSHRGRALRTLLSTLSS